MPDIPTNNQSTAKLPEPDFESISIETKKWIHGMMERTVERAIWLGLLLMLVMSCIDADLISLTGAVLGGLIVYLGYLLLGVLSPLSELHKSCAEAITVEERGQIYDRVCGALPTIMDSLKAAVATAIFLLFAMYFG